VLPKIKYIKIAKLPSGFLFFHEKAFKKSLCPRSLQIGEGKPHTVKISERCNFHAGFRHII
jgi:hypothetical protein